MFTGLIEDVGRVSRWKVEHEAGKLSIHTRLPLREMKLGSSIAVDGACLTVTAKSKKSFTVDVSPETLERTHFSDLRVGTQVNLERPLRFSDRLGGHLVTGHIDGLALVREIKEKGDFIFFAFETSHEFRPMLVPKGSVAVNGISLTVNDCRKDIFSVAVIPFTLRHTNLRQNKLGDRVNLETDLIGKYLKNISENRTL